MIYIDFNGRCGDQFFQYSFARKIQLATDNTDKLQFNFYNEKRWRDKLNDDSFRNDLVFFNVVENDSFVNNTENIYRFGSKKQINLYKNYKRFSRLLKKLNMHKMAVFCQKKLQKNGIYYDDAFFDLYCFPKKGKNVFLRGYFEDYKYYNDKKLIDVLIRELTPKNSNVVDDAFFETIKKSNSVCLSMRSWGEVSNYSHIINSRRVCDSQYYKNALQKIKQLCPKSTIIVFSDDIEWARRILNNVENVVFESKDYNICEKVLLMSSCKHFIISNSSFSWWTQFLSPNKEKIIISPNRWYNDRNDTRLINPNWIIIDTHVSDTH